MKTPKAWLIFACAILGLILVPMGAIAVEEEIPFTFTFQGELEDGGSPANGLYDFETKIFDSTAGGSQLGFTEVFDDVMVTNGRFILVINGAGANGARWFLEVGVRPGASGGAYVTLGSRQELTAAPSALTLVPGAIIRDANPGGGPVFSGPLLLLRAETGSLASGLNVETDLSTGIFVVTTNHNAIVASYEGNGVSAAIQASSNSTDPSASAVIGYMSGTDSDAGSIGVWGVNQGDGIGVCGEHEITTGTAPGVKGITNSASSNAVGVLGEVTPTSGGSFTAGVRGVNNSTNGSGIGVYGSQAGSGWGVYGDTPTGFGVYGKSSSGVGVVAGSTSGHILEGYSGSTLRFRVDNSGNVTADGTYTSPAADFAELLPSAGDVQPADVLVVGADGALRRSEKAFDPAVAGVYSTRPGFLGGATGENADDEIPLAIVGVVPVKVTNENGPIKPGDLLVASSVPGHAMRAGDDPPNGTVIGKSLQSSHEPVGVVKAILMLQ